jgi:hypothetical protein
MNTEKRTRRVVVGLDRRNLREALDAKRKVLGMSWRGVASYLAISPSTLTRLKTSAPSADTLVCLLVWLGHPMGKYGLTMEINR